MYTVLFCLPLTDLVNGDLTVVKNVPFKTCNELVVIDPLMEHTDKPKWQPGFLIHYVNMYRKYKKQGFSDDRI